MNVPHSNIIGALFLTFFFILLIAPILRSRDGKNFKKTNSKEDDKLTEARKDFSLKIQEMSKDKAQESAILYVVKYFENEDYLNVSNICKILDYLKRHEVAGSDFHELFLFLRAELVRKDLDIEAAYLANKTGIGI